MAMCYYMVERYEDCGHNNFAVHNKTIIKSNVSTVW